MVTLKNTMLIVTLAASAMRSRYDAVFQHGLRAALKLFYAKINLLYIGLER